MLAPAVVGEVAGGEPGAPELRGRVERGLRLRRSSRGRRGARTTRARRSSPRRPRDGAGRARSPPSMPMLTSECRRSDGLAVGGVGDAVRGLRARPARGPAPVVEDRLAEHLELHRAVHAARGADEHVVGVVVGGRARVRGRLGRVAVAPAADDQRVADDHPAGRRHPGRLDDVGARLVAAADRLAHVRGPDPPAARGAVEQRREDARRVEARRAEPLDRAVGRDQRAGVAVGEERVVGDRGERRARLAALEERASSSAGGRDPCRRRAADPRDRRSSRRRSAVRSACARRPRSARAASAPSRAKASAVAGPDGAEAAARRGKAMPGVGLEPTTPRGTAAFKAAGFTSLPTRARPSYAAPSSACPSGGASRQSRADLY